MVPLLWIQSTATWLQAEEVGTLKILQQKCVDCHSGEDASGEIDLGQFSLEQQLAEHPELLAKVIGAIEGNNMPPEEEPQLTAEEKTKVVTTFKQLLQMSLASKGESTVPIRRLNRFQYNYAVKDLMQLNRDVFPLPEKLMTRKSNYLRNGAAELPQRVNASSYSLDPQTGLKNVKAFPKDLRATHGFDNQANELTLSPLLLDAFFRLSVSILESEDFNAENVGIWKEFFQSPSDDKDIRAEIEARLNKFLGLAFREKVDEGTISRYADYAERKLGQGLSFSDTMKKLASAALSSPKFLYRTGTASENSTAGEFQYELASKLSFFLWASGPDDELLRLAERGELAKPEVLRQTLDRMFADPKIERFLDSFPAQWMQLENVLAATPDPTLNRYFRLDSKRPASLQMMLEPLLLFDAVFVENRPIAQLIKPPFSYRSEFLTTWYTSELKPEPVDVKSIRAENSRKDEERRRLSLLLTEDRSERSKLRELAKKRITRQQEENGSPPAPVDLMPYAAWDFDGDLQDSAGTLHLTAHGATNFEDGMVVLNNSYLQSEPLPIDLRAKTLEVWCQLDNLKQRGGGVLGIQGPGDFFDTIVLGERQPLHWISGSNGFSRTEDFPGST
ncbi:MAG: DUF1592 domain-containing protein, partial [Planctomycetota bacterium]